MDNEPRTDSYGKQFLLVTCWGGNDPEGRGGFVHLELGGSGCRWVEFDPENRDESYARLRAAREGRLHD